MLDLSKHMVVINGKVATPNIKTIYANRHDGSYFVTFKTSDKLYHYKAQNVQWFRNPAVYDPKSVGVWNKDILLSPLSEIYYFGPERYGYWHLVTPKGHFKDFPANQIYLSHSCLLNKTSKNIVGYLRLIADENALANESGENLLAKQYNDLDEVPDVFSIAPYLDPQSYPIRKYTASGLIYPFGCNESQLQAIQCAFENQISVIQGPPGTGKTQTILNILANIVLQGKTALVVSNNNSAVENVLEKLEQKQLGFFVAMLGNAENRQIFIEEQKDKKQYPEKLFTWKIFSNIESEGKTLLTAVNQLKDIVGAIFKTQNEKVELQQELNTIQLEQTHFLSNNETHFLPIAIYPFKKAEDILKYISETEIVVKTPSTSKTLLAKWKQFCWSIKSYLYFYKKERFSLTENITPLLITLKKNYYSTRIKEISSLILEKEQFLKEHNLEELLSQIKRESLACFRGFIANKYTGEKPIFDYVPLVKNDDFFQQYPIILSTCFSARNTICPKNGYDYVIMDEASQISPETAILSLSCARNAVIVGDSLQLPNVITEEDKITYGKIWQKFQINEAYNCATNSFLDSIVKIIPNVPQTLLREHYRCNPAIIDFCNQRFYHNRLLIMTQNQDRKDAMHSYITVEGNHSRGKWNRREIDVIEKEILPFLDCPSSEIGIIAPYNKQVLALKKELGEDLDIATVHKFQGREKDVIIMSTVDGEIGEFADNPNLLNVAVSRAKNKFFLVTSGNTPDPQGNIRSLIDYMCYQSGSVQESKISSVYDYLYKQYDKVRKQILNKRKRISEYDSENITNALLEKILRENPAYANLSFIFEYPLHQLIRDDSLLDEREQQYVQHPNSHIDFLIYNTISKQPVLAIEVDGYAFHKQGTEQSERDVLKDHILELYGIPMLRLSTTGSGEREQIETILNRNSYIKQLV